jgi:ABC-type sugar transport system substrate-binding protein
MRINLATLAAAAGLALLATSISRPAQAAGGWFEWRFGSTGGEAKPQKVNEYTTTHRHGMLSARLPVSMRSQFTVYSPRLQIQVPLKR